ncbi:MAG: LON peptidase substrate-binding domain-containing protein, partial [Paramuribaculum sp.]|nr:LON peptidase substrate-binding domain-containing protein [Paramuribaculum sp.]
MTKRKEHIVSLGQVDVSEGKIKKIPTENLPVLPTRDFVLFPGVTYPISLGREMSIRTAEEASRTQTPIAIICQKDPATENPDIPGDLYDYGVAAIVVKVFEIPDGPKTAILHGLRTIKVLGPGDKPGTVN